MQQSALERGASRGKAGSGGSQGSPGGPAQRRESASPARNSCYPQDSRGQRPGPEAPSSCLASLERRRRCKSRAAPSLAGAAGSGTQRHGSGRRRLPAVGRLGGRENLLRLQAPSPWRTASPRSRGALRPHLLLRASSRRRAPRSSAVHTFRGGEGHQAPRTDSRRPAALRLPPACSQVLCKPPHSQRSPAMGRVSAAQEGQTVGIRVRPLCAWGPA